MGEMALDNRTLVDRLIAAGVPITGQIQLTDRCNLSCVMCHVCGAQGDRCNGNAGSGPSRLTGNQWMSLVREACEAGMMRLLISGGEPLLHPDFRMFMETVSALGLQLVLNTNATLVTAEMADFLSSCGIFQVQVTLYAASDEVSKRTTRHVGAWRKALDGVDRLMARGVRVTLRTTLIQPNVQDLALLWEHARSRGLPLTWVDTVLRPAGFGEMAFRGIRLTGRQYGEVVAQFLESYRRDFPEDIHRMRVETNQRGELQCSHTAEASLAASRDSAFSCGAGRMMFALDADGRMTPCDLMPFPVTKPLQDGFGKAWRELREKLVEVPDSSTCMGCEWAEQCIRCPARLVMETGKTDACAPYLRTLAKAREEVFASNLCEFVEVLEKT